MPREITYHAIYYGNGSGSAMTDFGRQVGEWQVFYATIMGCSATLLGLLFVSVSLNRPIIKHRDNVHLMFYSRQTFGLFLSIISISLTFLIPNQSTMGIGIPLTCIGAAGLYTAARGLISRLLMKEYGEGLRRYGWPTLAFTSIVFAALHVLFFLDTPSLSLVMAGMIMLLVSATRSSWFFLMDLQEK
ncbi:MAG TPA: hypothetical protein PKX40_02295 [Spirochaetota bacterium]|nr:hypothetical protein [Spirochaetota bacterium]